MFEVKSYILIVVCFYVCEPKDPIIMVFVSQLLKTCETNIAVILQNIYLSFY